MGGFNPRARRSRVGVGAGLLVGVAAGVAVWLSGGRWWLVAVAGVVGWLAAKLVFRRVARVSERSSRAAGSAAPVPPVARAGSGVSSVPGMPVAATPPTASAASALAGAAVASVFAGGSVTPTVPSSPSGVWVASAGVGPGAAGHGQGRVLRFFVSSTFADMAAERDELVKFVFPRVRKLCEERGVAFGEVDLRWGITDEQKAEGQVLPICLAEIERTRPYFIGLLGERYGWVPEQIPAEVVEREGWLAGVSGRSVTELEILHGVLNSPDMAGHALFYFRDPRYVDGLPEQERVGFVEATHEGREKLIALKDRIRESGFPVREDYPDPRRLAEWVLADLTVLVNVLFPEGSAPSLLERERAAHEAFAASRTGVYVGRQSYMDVLDAHAAGSGGLPLLVVGESGSGKSALLANWAQSHQQQHPDTVVVSHFVGASAGSVGWQAMVRRLIGELAARFGFEVEIPTEPDRLRQAFAEMLARVDAAGGAVVVVDAVNQLEDREGALELLWLPVVLPPRVRVIVSTLPGKALQAGVGRGWPQLGVEPLVPAERRLLIVGLLAQYTKTLSPDLVGRIAAAPQTASPLFLRVLLEELRVFGSHEQLPDRIDHYLGAADAAGLFELVLARYETDYERDRPGLVRDAFCLLWAGRRGLTETELLDLLGSGGRLPHAFWAPLFLATEANLVDRDGVLTFFHDHLRDAVRRRYLPTAAEQVVAHRTLAGFFDTDERRYAPRAVDELPWQLSQAEDWERLAALLADLVFFELAWTADRFEVKTFWALVETNSPWRMVDAYQHILEEPFFFLDITANVAVLLAETGHPEQALALQELLSSHNDQMGDLDRVAASAVNMAVVLLERGQLDEAMAILKGQERICRQLGNLEVLHVSLGNQAVILRRRGQLDEAMTLHKEEERICRQEGNVKGLSASLGNQASILIRRGQLDEATALLKEQERICRQLGNPDHLQHSFSMQAGILADRGQLHEAMTLYKEQERICRQLGNLKSLSASLGGQANILKDRGQLHEAMTLYKEQERICRQLGNLGVLSTSLGNQALILVSRGQLDGAIALLQEQERICRQLGMLESLSTSLGVQALILKARGELDRATILHKEEEQISRQLGNSEQLAMSLSNQALLLVQRDQRAEALRFALEAREIATRAGLADLVKQIESVVAVTR